MSNIEGSILNINKYKVIILDNFYEQHEYDAILNECLFLSKENKLLPPEKTGQLTPNMKSNSGIFIDVVYSNRNFSDILKYNRKIFNPSLVQQLIDIDIIFRQIKNSNKDNSLLSYYSQNDYYKSHHDESNITVISWFFKEPKSFKGGNLFFEDDENLSVECKNNRTVIFPSFLRHAVGPVEISAEMNNKQFGRFSLTQLISYK